MTLSHYLGLISAAFRSKPKFSAMVGDTLSAAVQVQTVLAEMIPKFDVDAAVGDQLDIIGRWVGITRIVSIPIEGIYFSWDDIQTTGWDFGNWQPSTAPATITTLPDDAYRLLIKAKIAANNWQGNTEAAYDIWDALFAGTGVTILIQDGQNMSYAIAIIGGVIDSLTVALLVGGYIPLKPEGVRISAYYVSVDDEPVFGWDVESELLGGWDEASWVREFTPA